MARTPHDPARLEALEDAREAQARWRDLNAFWKESPAVFVAMNGEDGRPLCDHLDEAREAYQDAIWNLNWSCFYASRSDRPVVHTTQEAA